MRNNGPDRQFFAIATLRRLSERLREHLIDLSSPSAQMPRSRESHSFATRRPAAHQVANPPRSSVEIGNAPRLAAWEKPVRAPALRAERPVYCLGLCACAPAISVDGRPYAEVTPERLTDLVGDLDG